MYFYDKSKHKKNTVAYQNNELQVDLIPLISSYAKVYQESHKKNSKNYNSLVTALQDQCQINSDKLTFEYSLSQITFNFKALVDYIWYNSKVYQPLAILQTIDYDHLEDFQHGFLIKILFFYYY